MEVKAQPCSKGDEDHSYSVAGLLFLLRIISLRKEFGVADNYH